jgi:alkaline phosphatase
VRRLAILLGLLAVVVAACASPAEQSPSPRLTLTPSPSAPATASVRPSASEEAAASASATASPTEAPATLIAAGDIAACDADGDEATAALIATLDGEVQTLGDNAYPAGSDATYRDCFGPSWGAFSDRLHPAVGNHDLAADGGAAYWRYFGDRAGTPGEGWYAYDIGDWHVVVLNSNCELIACGPGSPQHDWLTDDLAKTDARCTLAAMHHPRFSSGPHGDYAPVAPLWQALDDGGADLLLVGHDHLYERFASQADTADTADMADAGVADPAGLRQITVGTGGYSHYAAERVAPNSELVIDDAFGVLVLTLLSDGYEWSFLGLGGTVLDHGVTDCAG